MGHLPARCVAWRGAGLKRKIGRARRAMPRHKRRMTKPADHHRDRLRRVLAHIDRHPEGALDVATLAGVASVSPCHFHRQFTASLGLPVHRYVQLGRLGRAAHRLAYRRWEAVTEIALDAGYDSPDAFTRAFRQRFGQAPSDFRAAPDLAAWRAAVTPYDTARNRLMGPGFSADQVTIVDLPDIPVAVMTHRGAPDAITETIRRFIAWRRGAGLSPRVSTTWNVFHAPPDINPSGAFRLDLCAGTDRPIAPNDQGVSAGTMPGGRCAALRVTGVGEDLEPAALFLYRDWLPGSGEALRDAPLFCRRVTFFPDVPAHEAVTMLYLPLR